MADFAPPTGPPPPKVPAGWKAVWNDQYNEWFYVNIYTKKSQWNKPDELIYGPDGGGDLPPGGAPPSYDNNSARPIQADKTGASTGEQMFGGGAAGARGNTHDLSADEELARKLQAEEDARAPGGASAQNRGEADSYYGSGSGPAQYGGPQQYGGSPAPGAVGYGQELPPDTQAKSKGGFLSKLLGKGKSSGQQGYPPQQQQYYQQPPQGYGQQPYYGQQPQYAQQPGRRPHQGMGMAGGAALGVGGGLLGGLLIGDALGHAGGGGYGGGDGGDGGDGGGDYGGGDGGGDFGGGDGGGDMGGGDF